MSQILKVLYEYGVQSTFKALQRGKFYNSTKFGNVSSVKVAVYPVYFTGNMADSTGSLRPGTNNEQNYYIYYHIYWVGITQ